MMSRLPACAAAMPLGLAILFLAPCTAAVSPEPEAWNIKTLDGRAYLSLEEVRSFYKFTLSQADSKKGTHTVGNGSAALIFGPGLRELSILGFRCRLSEPLQRDERGELYLSRTDMVKLIDPLLRPTYIAPRQTLKTIILDPGHGGADAGNRSATLREADAVLLLARQLATRLSQRGYKVLLTRQDDQYLSDQQRVKHIQELMNSCPGGAAEAIVLSLHCNGGRSDFHGLETYTLAPAAQGDTPRPGNQHDEANAALAFALHSSLITASGAQDDGCRRAHYSILSSLNCPAAQLELGYITHKEEGEALAGEEYRSLLSKAISDGVDTYAKALRPEAAIPVSIPPPPVVEKDKNEGRKDSAKTDNKGGDKGKKTTTSGKKTSSGSSKKSSSGKKTSGSSKTKKKSGSSKTKKKSRSRRSRR